MSMTMDSSCVHQSVEASSAHEDSSQPSVDHTGDTTETEEESDQDGDSGPAACSGV